MRPIPASSARKATRSISRCCSDGLAAEREQNITIDVAYRFFSTARRKFIVIDAPGHEEYTANMATGASVADLALVLVAVEEGLTRQTKRHLVILSMLGVRHVVLAVNKMDRVGWSRDAFGAVETAFRELAADLGFVDVACIPVAAKSGDNVTQPFRTPAVVSRTVAARLSRNRGAGADREPRSVPHADPMGQPARSGFPRL